MGILRSERADMPRPTHVDQHNMNMTLIQSKTSIVLAHGDPNWVRSKLLRLVRRLTRFAWQEFMQDVSRIEVRYGRYDDGSPKRWREWQGVRDHLNEAGMIIKSKEVTHE